MGGHEGPAIDPLDPGAALFHVGLTGAAALSGLRFPRRGVPPACFLFRVGGERQVRHPHHLRHVDKQDFVLEGDDGVREQPHKGPELPARSLQLPPHRPELGQACPQRAPLQAAVADVVQHVVGEAEACLVHQNLQHLRVPGLRREPAVEQIRLELVIRLHEGPKHQEPKHRRPQQASRVELHQLVALAGLRGPVGEVVRCAGDEHGGPQRVVVQAVLINPEVVRRHVGKDVPH
mmetsp:Transcript_22006/g.56379  ORF Transcript_22006/g.56379 Transcript_22006/m.56379 type:complete len:234 (-) Transcript_22006:259-960(-)